MLRQDEKRRPEVKWPLSLRNSIREKDEVMEQLCRSVCTKSSSQPFPGTSSDVTGLCSESVGVSLLLSLFTRP